MGTCSWNANSLEVWATQIPRNSKYLSHFKNMDARHFSPRILQMENKTALTYSPNFFMLPPVGWLHPAEKPQ